MFAKLADLSARALTCPGCGEKPASHPRGEVVICGHCGTKASVAEWAASAKENVFVGRADSPPVTNIHRESTPSSTVWNIPANGKLGFFMFFGTFWCLITGLVSGGFLFTVLTGGKIEGDMPQWLLIPFFGIFWIVGLVMLSMGVREKWLRHRLTVAAGELVLRREMFGRHREKTLAVADITSVEQKEFYQKNYQPVHGIEIKASSGKLRFGSTLTPEEKAWLIADLREVVFGSAPSVIQPASHERRSGHFSVEIPSARKHLWPLAIMLIVIGGTFIVVGVKLMNDPTSGGRSNGPSFEAVWVSFAAGMVIGGTYLSIRLLRDRHLVKKLEGNDTEIAIRSYRNGRVWNEKIFSRQTVADIRAFVSGNSNGRTMKRLEIIVSDKAEPLARWIDGEAADALVREVRAVL